MNVAFDLTSLCRPWTGTERYSHEVAKALVTHYPSIHFTLLFRRFVHHDFSSPLSNVSKLLSPFKSQLLTEQIWIPGVVNRLRPTVAHFPFFPPGLMVRTPFVFNLFDANLWRHPETLSFRTRVYTKPLAERALRHAKHVVTISDAAAEDIARYTILEPATILNAGTGFFTPDTIPSADDQASVLRRLRVDRPFILAVGTLEPRKNYPLLIRAFRAYVGADGGRDRQLVIAGRTGWGVQEIREAIREHGVDNQVVLPGHVSDTDLTALYLNAACLVLPSIYEGFGLPVLEALALGTPVIASRIEPLRTLLAAECRFFTPGDADSLRDALVATLSGSSSAPRQPRTGLAQRFAWRSVADALVGLYRSMA